MLHSHIHAWFRLAFAQSFFSFLLREGGRELFVGEIMGKYHPLLHELVVQASEMAEGKTRRCYYSQRGTFGFALALWRERDARRRN